MRPIGISKERKDNATERKDKVTMEEESESHGLKKKRLCDRQLTIAENAPAESVCGRWIVVLQVVSALTCNSKAQLQNIKMAESSNVL
jgi:hypothetical protein